MIKGVGADFLDKSRVENIFLKFGNRFVNKILSEKEFVEFNRKTNLSKRVSYLSNNFACKEAVSKVLGTGFSKGVLMKDIEILRFLDIGSKIRLVKTKGFSLAVDVPEDVKRIEDVLLHE